jgi:hypothetical protein
MLYKLFSLPFAFIGLPIKIIQFLYKTAIVALIGWGFFWFLSGTAQAACIGSKHVLFTPGTSEECLYKAQMKLSREQEAKQERSFFKQNEPSGFTGEVQAWENTFTGKKQDYTRRIGYDKLHALSFSWGLYYLPSEVGYSRQAMSHFAPSDITYHYYVNPSWSVGIKYQAYKLYASSFKDVDGNFHGSDTLDVTRWWSHATFHFDIAKGSQIYTMMGVNLMDSSRVWLNGVGKKDKVGSDQFLFEVGYAYFIGSNKAVAGLRFVDAPNGSEDFNTWHNLGATEAFIGITLGIF